MKYGFVIARSVVMLEHVSLMMNKPKRSNLDQAIKAFNLSVTLLRGEGHFRQAR